MTHPKKTTRWQIKKHACRIPPGGHHFIDRGETFTGASIAEVIGKVEYFRRLNGYAAGDPLDELAMFYAEKFPYMVEAADSQEPRQVADLLPIERAHAWVLGQYASGHVKLAREDEKSRRQQTCFGCQRRLDFAAASGAVERGLVDDIRRRSFLLLSGDYDQSLGFCADHGWVNAVACSSTNCSCSRWGG